MGTLLTVFGQDALTLGSACHRQPELLAGTHWRTASALPEAARQAYLDPTTVRLQAPIRVLVEDILNTSLQPGADVNGTIALARSNTFKPLTPEQLAALDIIQREASQ